MTIGTEEQSVIDVREYAQQLRESILCREGTERRHFMAEVAMNYGVSIHVLRRELNLTEETSHVDTSG